MLKSSLILGALTGTVAGIASIVYQKVYDGALGYGFYEFAQPSGIFIASMIGSLIAAIGYWLIKSNIKSNSEIIFNLLFFVLTFASILPLFSTKLPLEIDMPELFPGLAVPMHFFPAIVWHTFKSIVFKSTHNS